MNELRDVYITGVGAHLPGPPVASAAIEDHIGRIGGRDSALGRRALRWNGVETRHYALDRDGRPTTSNAAMCAAAIRAALDHAALTPRDLSFLATATTQGDYLVPGHGSNVHGELGGGPLELASFQSVCGSALMAAKSAWLSVRAGEHDIAAAAASEFSSRWFRPAFYEGSALVDAKGRLRPEADYLRFTLSDGAGAVVMEPSPRPAGLSLRVRFIDLISLADRFDPCMWAGAAPESRADPLSTWAFSGPQAAHAEGAIALLQDFELLKRVIRAWVGVYLQKVEAGRIAPASIDHLLCHYSARSLRTEIEGLLESTAGMIPRDRWFSNLSTVGNVGSASIWVMLEAFLRSGRLSPGQQVLCVVPESGRVLVGFMLLEAVE
ncbi:3-oxoacyl-[acyl-carrier-protein] synthase III C-terminal domain-containing protein [Phenylobacterium sp.]|uniref:3-oxoacyl-[acyl-carrier-protein] synthase III C-terminal domain-containing protein n=1 Tax=Phenylobacterium sp. TaxID=1871053 RepID=UPI0027321E29|nr:3-oxoacyl-[acyl-carrier-protein] synthase III C-terminal domain-containing protein [Phenylobacterium sp.]MDP1617989.1 3-oxoacyl-[acyl-carrier-protein] synthase III C-terminal domain-containing protein [Phenylobacterium sp.]MDP1986830.1 3-oxoacyl-[acyl-carrier-protein] synthase III C-terminal domain-containing protein [Phenylobacterium sp.]